MCCCKNQPQRDALVFQGRYAGEYEVSSKVDGKPSFKSGERAIWYNAENDGWIVGILANLGKFTGDIWTKDEFEGLTDGRNVWKYQNQGWKDAGPNDVDVQCIRSSKCLQVLKSISVMGSILVKYSGVQLKRDASK